MTNTLVSADSHICEPPDLWVERLPRQWKDRSPRVVKNLDGREGEFFVCENIQPRNVFAASAAGVPSDEFAERIKAGFAAAPASVWDPHARVREQDQDGVAAEVLFPTFADLIFGSPDAQFRRACFAAYNDFVADYCNAEPSRLLGGALVDEADVSMAVEELARARGLGLRSVVLRADPDQLVYGDRSFDAFWAAAVDLEMPVILHRGAVRRDVTVDTAGALLDYVMIPSQAQRALTAMVFGGVWERHPNLRVVLCEFDLLWLPHFLQRMQYADDRFGKTFALGLTRPAVDQLLDGVWVTFQHETEELAHIIGTWPKERLMWASDYPHADSTWPHSVQMVEKVRSVVGDDTTTLLACENVGQLYGLDFRSTAGTVSSTVGGSR